MTGTPVIERVRVETKWSPLWTTNWTANLQKLTKYDGIVYCVMYGEMKRNDLFITPIDLSIIEIQVIVSYNRNLLFIYLLDLPNLVNFHFIFGAFIF